MLAPFGNLPETYEKENIDIRIQVKIKANESPVNTINIPNPWGFNRKQN